MNLLYPSFSGRHWARMVGMTGLGALIAGGYGMLHDQVTFTISPEYFTEMKFEQFAFANFGFPSRVFVAEIGFLATWWVGLLGGWFLARMAFSTWAWPVAWRYCLWGYGIIVMTAVVAGVIGYAVGRFTRIADGAWHEAALSYGVRDVPAFVCVGAIHWASYVGGGIGLAITLFWMWRERRLAEAKSGGQCSYQPKDCGDDK